MTTAAHQRDNGEPSDEEMQSLVGRLRMFQSTGVPCSRAWRTRQLRGLLQLIEVERSAIERALFEDLGKPASEAWLTELVTLKGELRELMRGVRRWSRSERTRIPTVLQPGWASIQREPVGVVLVVAPWNYPINLVLAPMAAGLAAGNCVIAKPSELAPATSKLLGELVPRYVDPDAVAVVQGGAAATQAIINAPVDHVFFTGSPAVGRAIMLAAAQHLTPVTLELGGKSPAIVDRSANIALAARRVIWGKFVNAGQTCIAPDYVLVHDDVRDRFVGEMQRILEQFYGPDARRSPDYARIVSDAHVARVAALLKNHGGVVVAGGEVDEGDRYVAPTVVVNPDAGSAMMHEEIFGPILPVVSYCNVDEATASVNSRPTPLSMYLFAQDRKVVSQLLEKTRSGSVCINTTLEQFAIPRLPFGGLGQSGLGAYHGRYGYELLSHRRAIFRRPAHFDLGLVYPPYTKRKLALLRRLL